MSDTSKLPKWARELLAQKDRKIANLTERVDALRGEVKVDEPVGTILIHGYHGEPLPISRYFHLDITNGPSAGVEVAMSQEGLEVRCMNGWISAIPRVSNVMIIRKAAP